MEKMDEDKKNEGIDGQTRDLEISFDDKSNLEHLKEAYLEMQKNYYLPDFDSLNRDFQVEKIQGEETDYLIREIRKYIADKMTSYLRFIETLIQPSNAQMFVFMMIKSLNGDDMKKMQNLYKKLARKELDVVELELKFDENKEAVFVKEAYVLWQEIKEDLIEIIDKVKADWDKSDPEMMIRKSNYFG